MKRRKKQKRLPLDDFELDDSQEEIINDLKRRIDKLTGVKEEIVTGDITQYTTRNMVFVTLKPEADCVKVICELPYERILDMSGKCEVEKFAAEDRNDIVTYKVKTKFDIQYAVSIVQQSFMYRKRLKL